MLKLKVIIVGGGLGGLSAAIALTRGGHTVIVLEASSGTEDIGAGLHLAPNVTRVMKRWDLLSQLEEISTKPESMAWARYHTGEIVGKIDILAATATDTPYLTIHRGDFYKLLYSAAQVNHADIRKNARVVKILPGDKPSVILSSGETVVADLVIGADGVKSTVREIVTGGRGLPTAFAHHSAFRATIETKYMMEDMDLKTLLEGRQIMLWMGPGQHIIGYVMKGGNHFNMVFVSRKEWATEDEITWSAPASKEEIFEEFGTWEIKVQKLIGLITTASRWKLVDCPMTEEWVHSDGIVLIGDACHPLLPYGGQGAAMAIEDAEALALVLSKATSMEQVSGLLDKYVEIRKPRCHQLATVSRRNGAAMGLPDGPQQEGRDKEMGKTLNSNQEDNITKGWTASLKYDNFQEVTQVLGAQGH